MIRWMLLAGAFLLWPMTSATANGPVYDSSDQVSTCTPDSGTIEQGANLGEYSYTQATDASAAYRDVVITSPLEVGLANCTPVIACTEHDGLGANASTSHADGIDYMVCVMNANRHDEREGMRLRDGEQRTGALRDCGDTLNAAGVWTGARYHPTLKIPIAE